MHVLTPAQCRQLIAEYKRNDYPLIPDWPKALATRSASLYRIATLPPILEPVKALLGNDVMLWGACFIRRKPGQVHPWHNDIESSVPTGKTLSVWIGIEHTSTSSSLQMISRTHVFKESIQEVRKKAGVERDAASADVILAWAQKRNSQCELVIPRMQDGEALLFDGWLWHASYNTGNKIRTALLLQYATPDTPVRIPDPNNYEWPFKTLQHPKPPCIMVSGSDHFGMNRLVPAPVSHEGHETYELTNQMYAIDIPLTPDEVKGWKPFPIFRGSTPNLQSITCHVSALNPGYTPHLPHHHKEEEILMLLRGNAEVTLPDLSARGLPAIVSLQPGEFVYYPAWFYHTITAKGDIPANYLMFKWYNSNGGPFDKLRDRSLSLSKRTVEWTSNIAHKLEYGKYTVSDYFITGNSEKKFSTKLVFQQATDSLNALQCHTSVVLPGGGYASHTDAHDVAIVMLEGQIEVLGEQVRPNSVLFFPAGQSHDMHKPTEEIAKYLVFEFHGNHAPPVKRKRKSLWKKMKDPKSWKNKFSEIKNRLR